MLELRQKITSNARDEMSKEQREYLLRQQLRAIQQELGEKDPDKAEVDMLRERLRNVSRPKPKPNGPAGLLPDKPAH